MQASVLKDLAVGFDGNRMVVARVIREIREKDPQGFTSAALQLLADAPEGPLSKLLLSSLLTQPGGVALLCDPDRFSVEQAMLLIQQAKQLDHTIENKLAALLSSTRLSSERETKLATRVLDVLDRSADPATVLPSIRQLLQCSNARVRSKAALLIGRISRNPQWAKFNDPLRDQRVNANAIESLWGLDTPAAKAAFREAAQDDGNRAAGNGAIGLYLAGDLEGAAVMFRLSRSQVARVRSTSAWAMGHVADPRFLARLKELANDPDEKVRQIATRSIPQVEQAEERVKAAGQVTVQIRMARCSAAENSIGPLNEAPFGQHAIELAITEESGDADSGGRPALFRVTPLEVVIWSGGAVVEDFTLSEISTARRTVSYLLEWQGPLPADREVKVEVFTENGWGTEIGLELLS